jgi:hypothetical protein
MGGVFQITVGALDGVAVGGISTGPGLAAKGEVLAVAGADVGGDGDCRLRTDLGRAKHWDLAERAGARPQRAARMRVLPLGWAGGAFVAVTVGTGFAHQAPGRPSGQARPISGFTRRPRPVLGAGHYERFGHGWAVKGPVDHDRPAAVGLAPELGGLVVHDQRITQSPDW